MGSPLSWIVFNLVVLFLLAVDLGVAHARRKARSAASATAWTAGWIGLSFLFGLGIWHFHGRELGLQFFTGYLIEYALSVDNLFVFLIVFRKLQVGEEDRHRVLLWGILGALVFRSALIVAGTQLVNRFEFILSLLGGLLVLAGIRMAVGSRDQTEGGGVIRWFERHLPIAQEGGGHFFVRVDRRRLVTRLMLTLVVIEATDLIFALDSIPAALGVSKNPFIVYSSNAAAILGLRSLFFVVGALIERLKYLNQALAGILVLLGAKMIASHWIELPTSFTLGLTVALLGASIAVQAIKR